MAGDEEARQVVEQLNRDAGYEPVYAGTLENAAAQENFFKLTFGIGQGGWAHSCIGLRLLINSESTIEEDSRTSDEHDGCGTYGDGGWKPCRAARRLLELFFDPVFALTQVTGFLEDHLTWVGMLAGRRAAHCAMVGVGGVLVADKRRARRATRVRVL